MFQVWAYIRFLIGSQNEHGVHSPFVFELIRYCFYDRLSEPKKLNFFQKLIALKREEPEIRLPKNYNPEKYHQTVYPLIKSYRSALLSNNTSIEITDYGAGSRIFKNNRRKIKQLVKHSGTPQKRAELLSRFTKYTQAKKVLELGTSLGIGTSSMAFGNSNCNITTVEGCPKIAATAQKQFATYHLNNIKSINAEFSAFLSNQDEIYDLIFIDGNHQENATKQYFQKLLKNKHSNSVFIFDDIHWSKGMEKSWEAIKNHPEVTLTVDTFYWGFVFFRKEQKAKQHFKIRV